MSESTVGRRLGRGEVRSGEAYANVVVTDKREGVSSQHQEKIGFRSMLNILSCRSKSSLAMGIEVNRIDRGVVIVPGDKERGCLHYELDGWPRRPGWEKKGVIPSSLPGFSA